MLSILAAIERVAIQQPQKTAYQTHNASLTYSELWHLSDRLADYLMKLNLRRQQPIVIYGHMSPLQIVAFIGAVKAGHPYVPVDSSTPSERLQLITEASGAGLVLTTELLQMQMNIPVMAVHDILDASSKDVILSSATWVQDEDIHYIIYTSGSTGQPKGVQITASNLTHFVMWMQEHFPLQEDGVFLNQAPYSFDLSVMDLYPALVGGHTLYAITQQEIANPKALFDSLATSNTRVWTSTPSFAKMCLMNKEWDQKLMPALDTFLFCGEVLPIAVCNELMLRFPQAIIYNLYGPTETTVAVSYVKVTKELVARFEQLPIAPITEPNVSVAEDGEIIISGPTVSAGYLGAPKLTAKAFPIVDGDRIYQTGDIGYVQDGYLFFSGRKDFQVKLHGYRLEIEEIEKQISNLPPVSSCVVVPVYKEKEIISLSAHIVLHEPLTDGAFKTTKQLKALLSAYLPAYMIPKTFKYMDALPLNPNGKVDRKGLAVMETV
ncbi:MULTISPECIES: D-alanine--poly(phosphoribitol) ligase subunit DltA [Lysinibacillus]|uniref:D-alanine--poly(phosphoribitol) ligase subunit DltA n=1 Tax=Lysinibacillus TaxID=400634 RepID=UPI0021626832|nr:D-alanine--poly(phosphoribitol) ligase subunit DltA [Lysinibacillus boronitolerans]MCS1393247.1 D-alanine--poly(phosphoribitol) ligase subunit DltA [Lysinibacillus boronitolerans]